MTDTLPNNSDGWVPPVEPDYIDSARVLFLWDEMVKRGEIKVWFDEHGVFHVKAMGHPGVTMNPPRIGDTPAVHV